MCTRAACVHPVNEIQSSLNRSAIAVQSNSPSTVVYRRHGHVDVRVVGDIAGTTAVWAVGAHIHIVGNRVRNRAASSLILTLIERKRKIAVPSVAILILVLFGDGCL
jgi:hypothetical protein